MYNTSLLLQDKYGWLGCFLLKATGTTLLTIFLRVYFPNHHALLEQIRDVSRLPTQRPLPPRWCCSPSSSSTPSLRRHYIVGHNLDKYGRLGGFLLRPQLSLSTSSGLGRRLLASCCCCYLWHHLHRHRRRNHHHFHDHLEGNKFVLFWAKYGGGVVIPLTRWSLLSLYRYFGTPPTQKNKTKKK